MGVQQEVIVVGRAKYHTIRKMGLCCNLQQMSTEQDMPLQAH
jgi:hypothetical protein